jgi:CheY-like chemotaxis protein
MSMLVVLVEDDEISRDIVEATLRREGLSVRTVATGDEAVALLTDELLRPDLLVTDLQLPGDLDGWSVAQIFQDEHPNLPVIYITATDGESDHVGNSIYLRKPVSPNLLLGAIKALA